MNINKKQKTIVTIGVAVVILMGLFPPWTYTFSHNPSISKEPAVYGFILEPPKKKKNSVSFGLELDITRLSVQWIIVLMATFMIPFSRHLALLYHQNRLIIRKPRTANMLFSRRQNR